MDDKQPGGLSQSRLDDEQIGGLLCVTIIAAENLPVENESASSFCRVSLGELEGKTIVLPKSGSNPIWRNSFEFDYSENVLLELEIVNSVNNELIAICNHSIGDIVESKQWSGVLELEPSGTLEISLSYLDCVDDSATRASIAMHTLEHITKTPKIAYCKIYNTENERHSTAKLKTSGPITKFEEKFYFDYNADVRLVIESYNGKNQLLGTSHIKLRNCRKNNAESVTGDIMLQDDDGNLVAKANMTLAFWNPLETLEPVAGDGVFMTTCATYRSKWSDGARTRRQSVAFPTPKSLPKLDIPENEAKTKKSKGGKSRFQSASGKSMSASSRSTSDDGEEEEEENEDDTQTRRRLEQKKLQKLDPPMRALLEEGLDLYEQTKKHAANARIAVAETDYLMKELEKNYIPIPEEYEVAKEAAKRAKDAATVSREPAEGFMRMDNKQIDDAAAQASSSAVMRANLDAQEGSWVAALKADEASKKAVALLVETANNHGHASRVALAHARHTAETYPCEEIDNMLGEVDAAALRAKSELRKARTAVIAYQKIYSLDNPNPKAEAAAFKLASGRLDILRQHRDDAEMAAKNVIMTSIRSMIKRIQIAKNTIEDVETGCIDMDDKKRANRSSVNTTLLTIRHALALVDKTHRSALKASDADNNHTTVSTLKAHERSVYNGMIDSDERVKEATAALDLMLAAGISTRAPVVYPTLIVEDDCQWSEKCMCGFPFSPKIKSPASIFSRRVPDDSLFVIEEERSPTNCCFPC